MDSPEKQDGEFIPPPGLEGDVVGLFCVSLCVAFEVFFYFVIRCVLIRILFFIKRSPQVLYENLDVASKVPIAIEKNTVH